MSKAETQALTNYGSGEDENEDEEIEEFEEGPVDVQTSLQASSETMTENKQVLSEFSKLGNCCLAGVCMKIAYVFYPSFCYISYFSCFKEIVYMDIAFQSSFCSCLILLLYKQGLLALKSGLFLT